MNDTEELFCELKKLFLLADVLDSDITIDKLPAALFLLIDEVHKIESIYFAE